MITIKKLLCLFLGTVLLCCLFGCGKGPVNSGEKTPAQSTASHTVTVTFPEGYTLVQIAERLEENEVCSAKAFIALANDTDYILTLPYSFIGGIKNIKDRAFPLEGYIFPDTYEFYRGESPERALKRFLDNAEKRLHEEIRQRAAQLGYSLDEIITLASIIQEEAFTNDSLLQVSSVLHNRLESTSFPRLQCDVTIIYVNDYITESPYLSGDKTVYAERYNTYKCEGLPVGAICCPGIEAIEAALWPAETDYYYFVTDSEKNYYYATTYSEHLANCKKAGL